METMLEKQTKNAQKTQKQMSKNTKNDRKSCQINYANKFKSVATKLPKKCREKGEGLRHRNPTNK